MTPLLLQDMGLLAASEGRLAVPEWKSDDWFDLQEGSELWEVFSDGTEQLRAVYTISLSKFISVK